MKVRHPGRTVLAAAALASLLTSAAAAPAAAATGAAAKVAVVTGTAKTGSTPLNMRRSPSAGAERVGSVANGGTVWILCQAAAQQITGTVRTTNLWDHLANGSWVSDAYVVRPSTGIPRCAAAETPAETPVERAPAIPKKLAGESWRLPVGASLVSGFRTTARPSHDGVDLSAARNTPIVAAAAGTVIRVVCNVSAGSCDVDGNRTLSGCGWYAEVQHIGGIVTRYCHMVRRPSVTVGQAVAKGQQIGYVGTSGSSSGPHLHFEVHVNAAPATHANAVDPIAFYRSRGLALG
ncbi:putative M23-family peptidase [Actinoplanes missouriensis 431]|uniref:Putative M23-family peptidase n=1 Tax=Actinoplanes missouriensis (strain ATCC 14538 / DSM 43046 / CBS 188.64 / JCM 3121 / NBRC 102363 / NCIMB 12654 / NRRL B-3342 / UNCC 431) TaxID=512565 RepID=I0HIJ6_ACTM4|nr:peptidoglycan DD-metalloendopeptidase family protein [Actinoplanes missouriensis]BAL92833.1 putative M23-family peptidase [Actinoplanes missouriensis 431]